ncbi:MAG: 30S ribosome-binding factor RbfA [Candidatus Marinimicrobia bacterium]|jgi:ribosome-binding factor A|nr:30S ribosome-binding factor RbfA [Candidatus Neomarinimicrobiota bacterium]MBT3936288.1 30S ribosome-binding factor RbfA [Candidatus Neomarinimicrobiota bacterium]MBT3961343.1 30S ribosome-binding factor RbfA [Candidatus Neomarinimicrobiota bacterium]MBT4382943.1 30S ribosome-binding factor RbfA [Candidatus Neomarinimicrobiota bacterium]MBT4637111.1 30S ribosome-binding factor RbfA [Candidatus Neomarinimicrobiota bacterium]
MKSKRPYKRTDRVGNQILSILGDVLTKYIDLSHVGFVTFTHVDIAPDLRTAKIFYSILNPKMTREKARIEINQRRKAFKKFMSPELTIKHTPDLKFYHDDSLEYGEKIDRLFHDLDLEEKDDN